MAETVSVRIDKEELREIDKISTMEKKSKSNVLREVLESGIKKKKMDMAIGEFRKNKATAWMAARLAGVPLSEFMDALADNGIDFHYGAKELKEDFELI